MPFVLPPPLGYSGRVAAVLAYGKLSILEACTTVGRSLTRAEHPCDRVAVFSLDEAGTKKLTRLAGLHKWGPLMAVVDGGNEQLIAMMKVLSPEVERTRKLSLSGYEISESDYESIIRQMLDSLKAMGLSKIRLLRPHGNELHGEEVLLRRALDMMAFPYHGSVAAGPTSWVPESGLMKDRGIGKPRPRSEISMSPRLARLLVNLAEVQTGDTLLDPFCGSGTILSEAILDSVRCIGVDRDKRRVTDARENLEWMGVRRSLFQLHVGDARNLRRLLEREKVDAVVTEPLLLPSFDARPRTQTASDLLGRAEDVYSEALASASEMLNPGGRIVIVVPVVTTIEGEEVSIKLEGRPLGLRLHQPGPVGFEYPVRPSFESTRWVRRAVYVFESTS